MPTNSSRGHGFQQTTDQRPDEIGSQSLTGDVCMRDTANPDRLVPHSLHLVLIDRLRACPTGRVLRCLPACRCAKRPNSTSLVLADSKQKSATEIRRKKHKK